MSQLPARDAKALVRRAPRSHANVGVTKGPSTTAIDHAHAVAILATALDAVITIDHEGIVLEFNPAAEATFGYRREAAVGRELAELIVPPQFRAAHRLGMSRWTAAGPTTGAGGLLGSRIEIVAMRADGTEFPVELAISRLELEGPPLFTACVRDTSERKHIEELAGAAEHRYRTLVEQLPLVTYVDSCDDDVAGPLYLSPQVKQVLGYTAEEWLTTVGLYEQSLHPDDRERVLRERAVAFARGERLSSEYRLIAADGGAVWVLDESVLIAAEDGHTSFRQGFAVDITARKQAEEAACAAELRYRTLVEQLPVAIYIDAIDEASSNCYSSPQIEAMLGYSPEQWRADPEFFVRVLHDDDRERVLAAHERAHQGDVLCLEYRIIARDGGTVWVHDEAQVIHDEAGRPVALQGFLMDITTRRDAEDRLRYQAFHDSLTGLANRSLFRDRVEHALDLAGGDDSELAVLFLDIDDFKGVNDRLGHAAGDLLLCEIATRLRAALPASMTIARLGGDEFAVLIEGSHAPVAAAAEAAEQLLETLRAPFWVSGHELRVTTSVGIAVGGDGDELLRAADIAMYRAKAEGKAHFAFYAATMDDAVLGRLELVAELRSARIEEEFVLHYQPMVALRSGAIVGVEALLRWNHPTRGLVAPADFVAVAEECGLIVPIGRWALAEACRQAAHWRRELPGAAKLAMSVNISALQLQQSDFVDEVGAALNDAALDPRALVLEMTERVLVHDEHAARRVLEAVKETGVQVALDDFGTGYSSLSLLESLPVDSLKIDRSFVQRLGLVLDPALSGAKVDRASLVRAIADLGRAIGLTVVAEGIETAHQLSELRRFGYEYGQGFYFARPLTPRLFEALVRDGLELFREKAA